MMADHDRLSQVLYNLLANACNYGRKAGFTEVRTFDMDDQVLVEVVDDGIGISRGAPALLFERFYRVGKSRSRHEGGSGLGLAIIEAHHRCARPVHHGERRGRGHHLRLHLAERSDGLW